MCRVRQAAIRLQCMTALFDYEISRMTFNTINCSMTIVTNRNRCDVATEDRLFNDLFSQRQLRLLHIVTGLIRNIAETPYFSLLEYLHVRKLRSAESLLLL